MNDIDLGFIIVLLLVVFSFSIHEYHKSTDFELKFNNIIRDHH